MWTISPVSLDCESTGGAGLTRQSRLFSASNCSHKPHNAQCDKYNKTKGDQPHKGHANPAKWREAPSTHHSWPHHSPAISTTSEKACYEKQSDRNDSHYRPVNFVHWLILRCLHIYQFRRHGSSRCRFCLFFPERGATVGARAPRCFNFLSAGRTIRLIQTHPAIWAKRKILLKCKTAMRAFCCASNRYYG